jgi:hypothetical protein
MEPRLQELLARDQSVRLVLKDWPIFGGMSVYAAQVAIAAGWQGKYVPVHDALFTLPRTMDRDAVRIAAQKAWLHGMPHTHVGPGSLDPVRGTY